MQRQLNGGDIVSWANEVGTTEYSWEIIETWPKYHILYKNLGTVSKWTISSVHFSSVAQSCLSLCNHGLQHTNFPCPSPTPWACSNSCPSSWWCHQSTSSSVIPYSSCLQSFPAPGSFSMSQFFASGGQCIGASSSELKWTGLSIPKNIWVLFFFLPFWILFLRSRKVHPHKIPMHKFLLNEDQSSHSIEIWIHHDFPKTNK